MNFLYQTIQHVRDAFASIGFMRSAAVYTTPILWAAWFAHVLYLQGSLAMTSLWLFVIAVNSLADVYYDSGPVDGARTALYGLIAMARGFRVCAVILAFQGALEAHGLLLAGGAVCMYASSVAINYGAGTLFQRILEEQTASPEPILVEDDE